MVRWLSKKEVGKAALMRMAIWSARVLSSRLQTSSCASSKSKSSGVENETRVVERELRVGEPMREGVARLEGADLTIADVFILALVLARVNGNGCRNIAGVLVLALVLVRVGENVCRNVEKC